MNISFNMYVYLDERNPELYFVFLNSISVKSCPRIIDLIRGHQPYHINSMSIGQDYSFVTVENRTCSTIVTTQPKSQLHISQNKQ